MTDWRDQYDSAAEEEAARYGRMPLDQLLELVEKRDTGEYFTIWSAIAERGSAAQVGWKLFAVLISDRPYLERYHCANALLRVLDCQEFEPVQLSAAWPQVPGNLEKVKAILERSVPTPL